MAATALSRSSTLVGVVATVVIWLAFLGPFPASDGPIASYAQLVDQHFERQPIIGEGSEWIRVSLLVLGWSCLGFALISKRFDFSRQRLIVSASVILFLVQAFSSSFHDLAKDCLVWIPALTLLTLRKRTAIFMLQLLVALMFAQILVGVGAYIINYRQFSSPIVGKRASGLLGTPVAVYPLYLIATFFFLSLVKSARQPISSFLCGALAVTSIGLVALTFSRGAWLGLAAGMALQGRGKPWKSFIPSLGLATALVLAAFLVRSGPLSFPKEADASMLGHVASVKAGLDVLPSLALTGGGPHSFLHSQVFKEVFEQTGRTPVVPLCLPLNLTLDWGVLGMLVFCFIAVQGFLFERECSRHAIGFQASVIAIAVSGLFDVPIFRDDLSLPATLLLTGMLALLFPLSKERSGFQAEEPLKSHRGKSESAFLPSLVEVPR